jgi:hypothetical protein
MPELAPATMAVLPLREKSGSTRSDLGAVVASWVNFPSRVTGMFQLRRIRCNDLGQTVNRTDLSVFNVRAATGREVLRRSRDSILLSHKQVTEVRKFHRENPEQTKEKEARKKIRVSRAGGLLKCPALRNPSPGVHRAGLIALFSSYVLG